MMIIQNTEARARADAEGFASRLLTELVGRAVQVAGAARLAEGVVAAVLPGLAHRVAAKAVGRARAAVETTPAGRPTTAARAVIIVVAVVTASAKGRQAQHQCGLENRVPAQGQSPVI